MQIAFDTEKESYCEAIGQETLLGVFGLLNVNDNTCFNADCALR